MSLSYVKKQYHRMTIKNSLLLLRLTRMNLKLLETLNSIEAAILRAIVILFGVQYQIYLKLNEINGTEDYLEMAEKCKSRANEILEHLGK